MVRNAPTVKRQRTAAR